MVFNSGITNGGGMPTITANRGSFPSLGLPFQLYLDTLTNILYFDRENSWQTVKANPATPLTFSNGLTLDEVTNNVKNNLSTGSTEGSQNVIGGNDIDIGASLVLKANAGTGTGSFLNFYSSANGSRFFQDTGNWNFGGLTDTGFLANFEGDINFNSEIYCNSVFANNGSIADFSAFKISGTGGTGVLQMIRNSVTPSQVLNNTVFFADGSGRLSWFNSNTSWKRTIGVGLNGNEVLTANRMWTLPDADTMLAGLSVANVFTAAQTLSAGSTSVPSINFGDSQTGLFRPGANQIGFSVSNSSVMTLTGTMLTISSAHIFSFGTIRGTIRSASGSPENTVTAPVGSLYLRTDGGLLTTLYVKESGAGNTGWVGK